MIGMLHGRIASKAPPQLVVDVGGVGYELEAPMSTFFLLPAVGQEVRLLTHMVVREDAQLLYGFGTDAERLLFRNLFGCGVICGLTVKIDEDGTRTVGRFVKRTFVPVKDH